MIEQTLEKYIRLFKKLNRGYNKGLGKAPHKPVLLLSIIQLIQNGHISSNRIFITSELLLAFKQNWKNLVETRHTANFALPFFHMRSEPFWLLTTKTGMQLKLTSSKSIKSFKNLNETIAFAEIDKKLFALILDSLSSNVLTETLLQNYFPDTKLNYAKPLYETEELSIENQILNETKDEYQSHIKDLRESLDEDEFAEEIFIRCGLFKKTIPKIYNYSCCISGMKIESSQNAQMVDACHIIPFNISHDDTIPNGISLSPNLHRAFDRGLITINKNYVVRLSPTVSDNDSVYSISQFDGTQIMLPEK